MIFMTDWSDDFDDWWMDQITFMTDESDDFDWLMTESDGMITDGVR